MFASAATILVIASLTSIVLSAKFKTSLRREAPHLYELLKGKDGRIRPMPFVAMILLRTYRRELAEYPVSRAWASWLSLVHLIIVGVLTFMTIGMLERHAF
jgi:hypothetical protein